MLPVRCGGCGAPLGLSAVVPWCVHCRDRLGPPPGGWAAGVDGCAGWAAAVYRGRVRRSVLTAKRGAPQAATSLLLQRLPAGLLPPGATVTWVPGHPLRVVGRPDAGRALAGAVAEHDGLELRRLLRRSPLGRRQGGRSDLERRTAPDRLGLAVLGPAVRGPVVVVDDVRTTGTTLDHVGALLRAAGASEVFAVVVAAAPGSIDD